jgi:hypothetical protein
MRHGIHTFEFEALIYFFPSPAAGNLAEDKVRSKESARTGGEPEQNPRYLRLRREGPAPHSVMAWSEFETTAASSQADEMFHALLRRYGDKNRSYENY